MVNIPLMYQVQEEEEAGMEVQEVLLGEAPSVIPAVVALDMYIPLTRHQTTSLAACSPLTITLPLQGLLQAALRFHLHQVQQRLGMLGTDM